MSPCTDNGEEYRNPNSWHVRREAPAPYMGLYWNTKVEGHVRYQVRIVNSERTWEGLLAVLVDHSTEKDMNVREGGEPRPTGPIVGKVKPGITFFWDGLWEILCDHQPYQRKPRKLQNLHG